MKIIWIFCGLLAALVSILATQTQEKPYDIIVRDDKEPFLASIQSKTGAYAVQSCDEYGFGSAPSAKIETVGCITKITFDFKWRAEHDFSYHPRRKCDETVTIKVGDNLHGTFTVDACAKTATGIVRDETQNIDLMNLIDSDITDSKDYCSGPPPCN